MSAPNPSGSPRKTNTRLLWLLGIFGICLFPLGLTWWVLRYGVETLQTLTEGKEADICAGRLAIVAKGLELYTADHDGLYPPAAAWVDASWKYAAKKDPKEESESAFRCPTISKRRTGEFGYAINDALAGTAMAAVAEPSKTLLVFDSEIMLRNAHSGMESLPRPPRHRSSRASFALTPSGRLLTFGAKDSK